MSVSFFRLSLVAHSRHSSIFGIWRTPMWMPKDKKGKGWKDEPHNKRKQRRPSGKKILSGRKSVYSWKSANIQGTRSLPYSSSSWCLRCKLMPSRTTKGCCDQCQWRSTSRREQWAQSLSLHQPSHTPSCCHYNRRPSHCTSCRSWQVRGEHRRAGVL